MSAIVLGTSFGLLIIFLSMGVYVFASLGTVALILFWVFIPAKWHVLTGMWLWPASTNWLLLSIPLFVLMGELILRAGIADRLYRAISYWLIGIPGGLLYSNIVACGIFSAVSGSSVATAATIGTVAIPNFASRGYNERLVLGSLAAGGTLGILIPPSIHLILYGYFTGTSIGKLFMAGFIPGLVLMLLFMLLILGASILSPNWTGLENRVSWTVRLRSLKDFVPTCVLIVIVLGSIYRGVATPTEAAAYGVTGAFLLGLCYRSVNYRMLSEAVTSTIRTSSFILMIVIAGNLFNHALVILGVPQQIASAVGGLGLSQWVLLVVIILLYIFLGMFMESFTIVVTTVPMLAPLLFATGKDPVLLGVLFVILLEMALITPPVGLNLYVIHGLRQTRGSINDVIVGALPFVLCMLAMIGILILFPQIALWLPQTMFGS